MIINCRHIDDTLIAWTEIPAHEPRQRRNAEKEAVARIIAEILGSDVQLTHNADGAPLVDQGNISISHSQQLAVVAFNPHAIIGIDAEEQRAALIRVKSKYISPSEAQWLAESDYLRAWTVKEAVYKAAGEKRLALTAIEISPDWEHATAAGHKFSLKYWMQDSTAITLAVRL